MKDKQELTLRRISNDDCRFLFELRNDEEVRKNSFQTGEFSYEHHMAWFQRKMAEERTQIYILEQNGEKIGQVRVELQGEDAEISYALCKSARGQGRSKWMLEQLETELREQSFCKNLCAEVKRENIASQKIFESLGYVSTDTEYGFLYKKAVPLFTIMMCTHNSAQTLEAAVSSVRRQRFAGWELLILDNGSSDDTVNMLKILEKEEARIRCIYREDNVGWCKGISVCLEHAAGTYVMFLGADDFLKTENTLQDIADEVIKHRPEIIWTGCDYAQFENGSFEIVGSTIPGYKVYQGRENKLQQLFELMQNVYYNSVMHYVRTDFLKEIGVDFYQSFYGDCQGMTEALVKAEKMVVVDKSEYVLTVNTSQTACRVDYDYDTERQWNSIRAVLPGKKDEIVSYVARRVLNNLVAICQSIVLGEPIRNDCMNAIERSIPERFSRMEEMISTDAMGEMMYYGGREEYEECLIGAAGVTYWTCKKNELLIQEIRQRSKWLAEFAEIAMENDDAGNIVWRERFTREESEKILQAVDNPENRFHMGVELLLRKNVWFEDDGIRAKLEQARKKAVAAFDKEKKEEI